MSNFERLAEVIRKIDSADALANIIENITEDDVRDIDDLAEYLENELAYACE